MGGLMIEFEIPNKERTLDEHNDGKVIGKRTIVITEDLKEVLVKKKLFIPPRIKGKTSGEICENIQEGLVLV